MRSPVARFRTSRVRPESEFVQGIWDGSRDWYRTISLFVCGFPRPNAGIAVLLFVTVFGSIPLTLRGQEQAVYVTVINAAGQPITDADVSIVNSAELVVAEAQTDSAGRAHLVFPQTSGTYEVRARRIGFAAAMNVVQFPRESLALTLQLTQLPQTLSTVHVTADQSEKRKRLFVNAASIDNSKRQLRDGMDVITKLRPDMVYGLGGSSYCQQPIQNLWINGKWIPPFSVSTDAVAVARAAGTVMRRNGSWRQGGGSVPDYIISALAEIHPEHIAEMSYHDCTDTSLGRIHGESALFIVLKVGIAFDPKRGTYALTPADSVHALAKSPVRKRPDETDHPRILGVFDAVSGAPIDSCAVTDSTTGTTALTTKTGTISLAFLDPGINTLTIARSGYNPISVQIDMAPADSVPVTIVLWPAQSGVPR